MVARRALLSSISVTMLMGRCCCCDASRALVLMLHPPFLSLMSLSDTVTNNNYDNKNDSGILCLENSALNSRALYTGYCLGCTEWPISDTSTIHPAISPPLLLPPPTFQAIAPAPPITKKEETTVKAISKCSNSDMNQRDKEGELQLTSRLVKETLIMAYYFLMVSADPYGNNIEKDTTSESPIYTQMIFLTLLLVGIASMAAINNNNEEEQVSSTNDSGNIPPMKRAKSFTFLDTTYTEEGEEEETPRASEPVSPSQFLENMLKAFTLNKEKKKNTNNNKKEEKTKEKKEQVLKKEKNQKQQQHRRVTVSADSQDYTAKGNEEKENNIILADLLLPSLNRTGTKMKNREDPKKKEEPLKEKKVYGRGGRLIQVV